MDDDHEIVLVRAHPLTARLDRPNVTSWGVYETISSVLVEVRTNCGVTGVGEALGRFAPAAYVEIVDTLLSPRLMGRDSRNIAALWQTMRRALSGKAGGILVEAIAAVDIALWDILGKNAGMPISALLGGVGRRSVRVYGASVNWGDDARADSDLDRLTAAGFDSIKVKIGGPVEDACRRIERVRARAGDKVELTADANWTYSLSEAERAGAALAANSYAWFEEPLRPEDEDGYEELARRVDVPLAAGESNFALYQAKRLVEKRVLAVLQPNVTRAGGISETLRMVRFADAHNVGYAPHLGMSGIVCEAANLQLAAAVPNFRIAECTTAPNRFKSELADLRPGYERARNGQLDVPQGPGLGIEIDWDAVARMRSA